MITATAVVMQVCEWVGPYTSVIACSHCSCCAACVAAADARENLDALRWILWMRSIVACIHAHANPENRYFTKLLHCTAMPLSLTPQHDTGSYPSLITHLSARHQAVVVWEGEQTVLSITADTICLRGRCVMHANSDKNKSVVFQQTTNK